MHTKAQMRRIAAAAAIATAGALLLASCSSDDDKSAATTSTTTVVTEDPGRSADEVTGPVTGGAGINRPQPAVPVPDGYIEEEFFIGGRAVAYDAVGELPDDGTWNVAPGDADGEYRTRVIVRRPATEEDFSGTVLVEWLNVSAVEASPDWAYISQEVGRSGHAYVSVSSQAQGVEGGETIFDVTVDSAAASELGAEASADNNGLVNIDPDRYGTLTHPGDEYAFDIFSQVGRALTEESELLLGGLEPEQVVGTGESQSAFFLTTYANAVHPLVGTYNGYMIHSRGASAAPLDGQLDRDIDEEGDSVVDDGVLIRTDLDVPVFIFQSETDLTLLGFANARQPDTDLIRTWEVAGTAHADAHQFRALLGGPRDPSIASMIGCTDPVNTGPHHETYQAAMNHLVAWAAGGPPPPEGAPLELEVGDEIVIARDENGIALGGVRTPLVDVPTAAMTGESPIAVDADNFRDYGVCPIFGTTTAFDRATLIELHGSGDLYLEAFATAASEAVAAGYLLQSDADELLAEAEGNVALFG